MNKFWSKLSIGLAAVALMGAVVFVVKKYRSDDCCAKKASCCTPESSCCKTHHNASHSE